MKNNLDKLFADNKIINYFLWVIISLGLLVYKLIYHELWKDEWQAWLVARDQSIGEMLSFLNYEGHPSLWYLYLKIWSFVPVQEEILLQLSHGLLLVVSLYYLFARIKLPTIWKLLISLSYFIVFEYGVINRGYIWVILLSLICVDLIAKEKYNRYLGFSLLLLCQTEAYGVIIAGAITIYIIFTYPTEFFKTEGSKNISKWSIAGLFLFILTVYPRGNEDDFSRAYNQQSFSSEVIHESIQGNLANVFTIGLIDDTASMGTSTIGFLVSVILLVILIFIFLRDRRSMISMLFGLFGFITFGILIFTGGVRQWGMVYLLFAVMLILSNAVKSEWKLSRSLLVTLLMIAPVIHGIKALIVDAQIPFSNAKEVGLFIKDKVPENVPVIVINKFETAPVGAYADRPLYELPSGQKFTYFKWLEKVYIPTQSEINLFTKFKKVGGVVLLSPTQIDNNRFPNAQLWKEFTQENFKKENYWLYSVPLEK